MKNILLILVGGTICTALNGEGTLSVSRKAGVHLKANFECSDSPCADKVNIDLSENLFILSENMTMEKWNLIIDTYRKHTVNKKYDGVIFAHGTDTLAYSAALFSMILSNTDIPVFFASANERLTSPRSNGNANFACAVECICAGITPNVYVAYKNISDGKMYLHLASRLTQCENYSEDFHSVGAVDMTDFSQGLSKIKDAFPKSQRKAFIDIYDDWHLRECVLMIKPYVGINYASFDYGRYSAVLHGTFHSGTACVQGGSNSILYMIDRCAAFTPAVDTYLSPSSLSGEIYETVSRIGSHTAAGGRRISFLYGYTNETAYCKLLLAYSLFEDEKARKSFIESECNFEKIGG